MTEVLERNEEAVELPAMPEHLASLPCRCGDPECTVPYGLCHCGCGYLTEQWTTTDPRSGRRAGDHALVRNGHFKKIDGSGPSLPFRLSDKKVNKQPFDQLQPHHQQLVLRDFMQAIVLYECFEQFADSENRVGIAAMKAIKEAGRTRDFGKLTDHSARNAGGFLTDMGATKPNGPSYRFLVKHPKEARPDLWEVIEKGDIIPTRAERAKPAQVRRVTSSSTTVTSGVASEGNTENRYRIVVPATVVIEVHAPNVRSITDAMIEAALSTITPESISANVEQWDVATG